MLLQAGRKAQKSWLLHFWKHKAFLFSFATLLGAGQTEGVQPVTPGIGTGQQSQGLGREYQDQNTLYWIPVGAE